MKWFEIFDLPEDATIEQIQQAYEQKAARYNSDIYADEPQYAKRKLEELRHAFETALAQSGLTYCPSGAKPDFTYEGIRKDICSSFITNI